MGWDMEEQKKTKKYGSAIKIIGVFIILLIVIICAILALLYTIKANAFVLSIDGKTMDSPSKLIMTESKEKYINIKSFSKLVGYDFHIGEYKEYAIDQDKCYVYSANETASFYLNSNKICKVETGKNNEDYKEIICTKNTIKIGDEFYAPEDSIEVAFNVSIKLSDKKMTVVTLNKLIATVEKQLNPNAKSPEFNSLLKESFENQKALLYNYAIISKKTNGLYCVISLKTGEEVIPDKYKQITFSESTKEFLVTNSSNKVGIIDEGGQNKIEQIYDSIKVINSNPKLYLVETDKKYGVLNETGNIIVHTEYDSIGIDASKFGEIQNQYVLLNSVIPVCKDKKYGLFDLDGAKVLETEYDGLGCQLNTVKIEKTERKVTPLLAIKECNGIVVKNKENYDLFLIDKSELVRLQVSSIYSITNNGETNYYMIYKDEELDLIENLIRLGYINENEEDDDSDEPNSIEEEPISAVINEVQAKSTENTSLKTVPQTGNTTTKVTPQNSLSNIVITQ